MKVNGTRTEYRVEIDVAFNDIIKSLKQKSLNKYTDTDIDKYYIKNEKIVELYDYGHDIEEIDIQNDDPKIVEVWRKIKELEQVWKDAGLDIY